MRRFQVKIGLIVASWALILVFGCHQKKPPIPPQEQPPTIATAEQHPETEPKPQTTEPQTQPPAPQEQPTQATNKPPDKPSPKHPKPHPVKKPTAEPDKAQVEVAKNNPPEPPAPPRIVIQEGGSNSQSGQTGTGAPGDDTQATKQLLDSTDNNVRNIEKRQLSANESSTLSQIKDYVKQSRQAIQEGDL